MIFPQPFFDPDHTVIGWDKAQHLVGGALLLLGFGLVLPPVGALLATIVALATFELGQWDIARNVPELHDLSTPLVGLRPFLPGYGFGLLDLAAGIVGAFIALAARRFLHI